MSGPPCFRRFLPLFRGCFATETPLRLFDIILHRIIFTRSYPQFPQTFPQRCISLFYAAFCISWQKIPRPQTPLLPAKQGVFALHNVIPCGKTGRFGAVVYHNPRLRYRGMTKAARRRLLSYLKTPARPCPWWRRRSAPVRRSSRPDTHSSPARRSSRRCRRTTAAAAGTASPRPFHRHSANRRG